MNLLGNAVKYTQPGGHILVLTAPEDGEIKISVKDDGLGIPKKFHRKIFEKFWQVEGTIRKEKSGAGLGLYVSRQLVKMLGGRIWVDSEPGKGSTFSFTLPMRTG